MRIIEPIFDKVRPGWRNRSKQRRSIWHLPKVIISFLLMGICWYFLFRGMWEIHLMVHPRHVGRLGEFWQSGIGLKAFVSSFFLAIPLILPASGISFILTNFLFWMIPPTRKVFEIEAAGDDEMSFSGATAALLSLFIKYLFPIGIGLSLLGALTLSSLN